MNLRNVLKPECVEVGLTVGSKDEALREIVRIAKRCPDLSGIPDGVLLRALQDREKAGSTGIGDGVALPHCRVPQARTHIVGLVTLASPVDFDAIDNKPVRLMAFIIAPSQMSEAHAVLLSQISRLLVGPGAAEKIVAATDSVGLYQYVMSQVSSEETEGRSNWPGNLFRIVLDNEDLLYDLLPIFSSIPGCQTVVADVDRATAFLRHMPIFASFWDSTDSQPLKMITAVVPKAMTNEVIRQIDQRTNGIAGRKDALLTVQELFFCAGNLS